MKIDHHLHTSRHSPDSIMHPLQLIESAREAGLDGVVITEHDHQWDPEEVAELAELAGDLVVLSGVEVSAREGHFLVYGLPNLDDAPPGIKVRELVRVVRYYGGAIVAAHPYRWGQDFGAILDDIGPCFDALELASNNIDLKNRDLIERSAREHPSMGVTGSSDGHDPSVVGCYYSHFPAPIRTIGDFVEAIKSRSGRPGHSNCRVLASGPLAFAGATNRGGSKPAPGLRAL